jgi:hypothetical protein
MRDKDAQCDKDKQSATRDGWMSICELMSRLLIVRPYWQPNVKVGIEDYEWEKALVGIAY